MRGYFAIGAEGLSKRMNLGTLMRSAHAFGANFFFTVDADQKLRKAPPSDTSKSPGHLPVFTWDSVDTMDLPRGCQLVGIELTDEGGRHALNHTSTDRADRVRFVCGCRFSPGIHLDTTLQAFSAGFRLC